MPKLRSYIVAAVIAATAAGCLVRARPRPCHTDCWWSHGRRVCERRC